MKKSRFDDRRDLGFHLGIGVAVSTAFMIGVDKQKCKEIALGIPYEDFRGVGLSMDDIKNLRKVLKCL